MSCVAAVVEDGKVYMAADSFLGWEERSIPRPKEFRKLFRHPSGMLVGVTGSSESLQRIRSMSLPMRTRKQLLEDYIMDTLGPSISALVIGSKSSTEYLIGIEGRLFHGFSGSIMIENPDGYAGIGSGGGVATGSLATSTDRPAAQRVRLALQVAERFTPTVSGPIIALSGKARTTFEYSANVWTKRKVD